MSFIPLEWFRTTLQHTSGKDVIGRTTASFRVIKRSGPGPLGGREEGPVVFDSNPTPSLDLFQSAAPVLGNSTLSADSG